MPVKIMSVKDSEKSDWTVVESLFANDCAVSSFLLYHTLMGIFLLLLEYWVGFLKKNDHLL